MRRNLALTLALLGVAASAQAAEPVGILDVIVDGVPPDAQVRFEEGIEEGLRGAGVDVVPKGAVAAALAKVDVPEGCSFGPCLRAVGKALAVKQVLAARITAVGPSFSFILTFVDTASGAPTSQVADGCAVCTLDEALASVTLAVVSLATGAGDTVVTTPLRRTSATQRPAARRSSAPAAWWMAGFAVASAITGAGLASTGDAPAWAFFGLAGGLAAGGVTLFALDRSP